MNSVASISELGVREGLKSAFGPVKMASPTMMAQIPPKKVKSRFSARFS